MDLTTALHEVERAAGLEWNTAALGAIEKVARRQLRVHVDDVLAVFPDDPPNSRAAWGPVWIRAKKFGFIEPTDEFRRAEMPQKLNPGTHAGGMRSFARVYKSLVFEG